MVNGNPKQWFRSIEAAAIAGLVFAVLSVVAMALVSTRPPLTATDAEVIAWYSNATNRTVMTVGLSLFVIAAVAFLWFIAVIRRRVGTRDDRFIAAVFFGSGILLTGVMLAAAAAVASPAVTVHLSGGIVRDPGALNAVSGLGSTLALLVLLRIQGVFVVTVSTLALRTGAFNRWLSLPRVTLRNFFRLLEAHWLSLPSNLRLYKKNLRRIFGMLKTYCLCGTG